MIIDSSAIVAVILGENRAEQILELLGSSATASIAAPTRVELTHVTERKLGPRGTLLAERLLAQYRVSTAPFTERHAELARDALRRFGRGSGSPARLNLGDSYSYALAAETGEPLLFVGDDFTHTDLRSALE